MESHLQSYWRMAKPERCGCMRKQGETGAAVIDRGPDCSSSVLWEAPYSGTVGLCSTHDTYQTPFWEFQATNLKHGLQMNATHR